MTREDAIAILRCLKDREAKCLELISRHPHPNRLLLTIQATDMAIEALKREDTMLKEIERVVLYGERGEVNE